MKIAAPAKINLALHVTGQRPDGYHLIESLVVFAEAADPITIESADTDTLTFSGPFGALLLADTAANLVLKARDALRAATSRDCPPVAIQLEKYLPLSSGIGGGSADAAATLKGLNAHWNLGLPLTELSTLGAKLGADVPMCLHGKPLIAKGIGEVIELLDGFPELYLLLVNPGVSVSTPAIFKALMKKDNDGIPPIPHFSPNPDFYLAKSHTTVIPGSRSEARNPEARKSEVGPDGLFHLAFAANRQVPISGFRASLRDPGMTDVGENLGKFITYLRTTRNDLQTPALNLQPIIAEAIAALGHSGALFARMSGSGATCFGVFADRDAMDRAKAEITKAYPDWWVA